MQNLRSTTTTSANPYPQPDEGTKHFRWSADEYYRAAEMGFFNGRRVELIEGEIIEMAPMGSLHATGITLLTESLRNVFKAGYFVRIQGPFDIDENSQPEPDVAVVQGDPRDYASAHPKMLVLVAEVSLTSLELDRVTKGKIYAKAGVPEYWLVNLRDRCVEVFRDPVNDPNLGFLYAERSVAGEDESISSLVKPGVIVKVADILP